MCFYSSNSYSKHILFHLVALPWHATLSLAFFHLRIKRHHFKRDSDLSKREKVQVEEGAREMREKKKEGKKERKRKKEKDGQKRKKKPKSTIESVTKTIPQPP